MMLLPSASKQAPLREKIGDVCFFAEQPPRLYLEEKFKRFEMAARLGHRLSPSIKPMACQKHSMRIGIRGQYFCEFGNKIQVILRVYDDGDFFKVIVRSDAGK